MATEGELRRHVARLVTILERYGAAVPSPTLRSFTTGERAFAVSALLPGPAQPTAAEVRLAEVWRQASDEAFQLDGYRYDFIERPLDRRLAFHRHDAPRFLEDYTVSVHEHCEEVLGQPTCQHYFGLPVSAYEAIQAFAVLWGQPGPIGCDERKCMH